MGSEPSKPEQQRQGDIEEDDLVAQINGLYRSRTQHQHDAANEHLPSPRLDEFDEPVLQFHFAEVLDLVEDEDLTDSGSLDGMDGMENVILEEAPPTFKSLNKWQAITNDWERWSTKKKRKLKKYIRKGIPEVARPMVWKRLVGSDELKAEWEAQTPGYYQTLLMRSPRESAAIQIAKDITRTMPTHPRFQTFQGRRELENVLRAYAVHDPELGYCQGMGFLVCMFLLYYAEEDSFYCLLSLLNNERFAMRDVFMPDLPGVHERCFQIQTLLKKLLPKVHDKFQECMIEPHFYSTQWFMTCFTSNIHNYPQASRLWDVYLSEGLKIQFRIGLAILKAHEAQILQTDMTTICGALQGLEVPDDVLTHAFNFKITRAQLKRASLEHQNSLAALQKECSSKV